MKIIVGLGNPGENYQKTRHNVGFIFLDHLAGEEAVWKFNKRFKAYILEKGNLTLIKPQTFMNNSGFAVRSFLDYYKLLPKKLGIFTKGNFDLSEILTVVHDDLDIDFAKYKISVNASSAGHNGVESIIKNLKTKKFTRLRLGIKNEFKSNIPGEKFVLQKFLEEELLELKNIFNKISI